jgi:hypothetical protein
MRSYRDEMKKIQNECWYLGRSILHDTNSEVEKLASIHSFCIISILRHFEELQRRAISSNAAETMSIAMPFRLVSASPGEIPRYP